METPFLGGNGNCLALFGHELEIQRTGLGGRKVQVHLLGLGMAGDG